MNAPGRNVTVCFCLEILFDFPEFLGSVVGSFIAYQAVPVRPVRPAHLPLAQHLFFTINSTNIVPIELRPKRLKTGHKTLSTTIDLQLVDCYNQFVLHKSMMWKILETTKLLTEQLIN